MFLNIRPLLALSYLILISASFEALGQVAATSASTGSDRFLPVSAVREGMRGVAKTVFNGTEPEEFSVEILGVVPGAIGPKQDLIVGRISGGKADRTGVFAGMSGSPVYVDGKLIGAISYSFPFSKESMCGITPIEQMISIFEQQPLPAQLPETRLLSFAELASTEWMPSPKGHTETGPVVPGSSGSMLSAVAGQSFRPIGTPVTFNGISAKTLDLFAPQLAQAGLVPVAAAGGSAAIEPMKKPDATTLVGGDSVSMQLTRGDVSMAAAGTVTLRDDTRIYAFGHPFLGLGSSELPMSESSVVTVVPNVNNSFKLAVPGSMVGTMTQDRATGVYGKLGQAPKMIPVQIKLVTSRGQQEVLNFEVARDIFLSPLLINIGIANVLLAQERGIGESMIDVDGEIKISGSGSGTVKVERRFAGSQATAMAAGSIAAPVSLVFRTGFEGADIESVSVELRPTDGSRTATLDRITVDRASAKAGETVEIQAFARTNTGKVLVQNIPVLIPKGTPAGDFSIVIGDGAAIERASAVQQFVPRNVGELVRTMNSLKLSDRLYSQIFRTSAGAIVGSNEMPDLPPSVLATLNNERASGGVKPAVRTVISESPIAPADFIITGQQTLTIEVIN